MADCKVCSNAVRRPVIDAALAVGISPAQIARDQVATGWPILDATIRRHQKHYTPPVSVTHPGAKGKDFAIIVRDKAAEMFEGGQLDLSDKDTVPGISAGLKAQSEINKMVIKRDTLKVKVDLAILFAGGPPPPHLLGPGPSDEAEFEEVPDDDAG